MPTYSYRCKKCGHEFTRLQKISDETRPRCPQCKGGTERLLGPGAGLLFKGSGFYITDYARGGKKDPGREGGESGKSGGDKSGADS